jgi:hypothetical protein
MKYKIAGMAIILLMMLASGGACVQTGSAPRAELTVLKHELTRDQSGKAVILVTVKNTSNVKAELAEVKVRFYDAQKNLIDSSRDSVMNLGPDETWDFTIACQSDRGNEVKSYEIETTAGTSSGGL